MTTPPVRTVARENSLHASLRGCTTAEVPTTGQRLELVGDFLRQQEGQEGSHAEGLISTGGLILLCFLGFAGTESCRFMYRDPTDPWSHLKE